VSTWLAPSEVCAPVAQGDRPESDWGPSFLDRYFILIIYLTYESRYVTTAVALSGQVKGPSLELGEGFGPNREESVYILSSLWSGSDGR
jgi:hypothetical protein